jgi:hypothetical protein
MGSVRFQILGRLQFETHKVTQETTRWSDSELVRGTADSVWLGRRYIDALGLLLCCTSCPIPR